MNEKKKSTETLDIDLGSERTFFVANDGNYFGIAFDKLFGVSELEVYNTFEMSSKRNFKNLAGSILSTYEELFVDKDGSFKGDYQIILFKILSVKSSIMAAAADEKMVPYEKFIEYMDSIMNAGDKLLLNTIDTYVNEHYALNLDQITQETKERKRKVNEELQFLDEHARELLKIAYLYRVMIPVVSTYFYYSKGGFSTVKPDAADDGTPLTEEDYEDIEFGDVNSNVFDYLFDKFAKDPDALRNKLYRLTYSGVSKTSYSDKRFWLAGKNVGITEKSEALEIYKKVLTNAIPKLSIDGDKNVISFLQSVINNQVDFLFQNKFKYHFVALGNNDPGYSTNDDDDSSLSEFERMEIQQTRKDEGAYLIRKLNIKDIIEKIPEKLNVGVSDAEVKELLPVITRNAIQEQIIAIMTFKYFNDKNALKFVDFYQYCYLLIACKKYLIAHKFVYLPKILTATCEKHRERSGIAGNKIREDILNSKKYKDLISGRYNNFEQEIEKTMLAMSGTIYSSIFKDKDDVEIFDSAVKVGKIADEIVSLISYTM